MCIRDRIKNGSMIVYTSADSVMQICGNEETFDLKNLYRCCEIARELTMKNEWKVGRITVSYTHLDVYKRQVQNRFIVYMIKILNFT